MDEEQKKKWRELIRLTAEFNRKMDEIFPRDEHGDLQESSKLVTRSEVDEVLKLARQVEQIGKELGIA